MRKEKSVMGKRLSYKASKQKGSCKMKKIGFVLFISFVVLILGLYVNSYASECGDVLSDGTWKGVVGYHNGIYHAGQDPNPDDGQWTCGSLTDHGWS